MIRAALAARRGAAGGVPLATATTAGRTRPDRPRSRSSRSAAGEGAERLVVAVPRLIGRPRYRPVAVPPIRALWADTRLPLAAGVAPRWTCALSGRSVPVRFRPAACGSADLFGILPVALLLAEPDA